MPCNLAQTWSGLYTEQCEYIENMLSALKEVDYANSVVTVYQATDPTTVQLLNAWSTAVGDDSPPPPGTVFAWYNSSLDQTESIYLMTNDLSPTQSSGIPISYTRRDTSLDFVFINTQVLLDPSTVVASYDITPLTQDYRWQWVFFALRSLVAAVEETNFNITYNTVGGATAHTTQWFQQSDTTAAAGLVSATTNWRPPGMIPGATTREHSYASGLMFLMHPAGALYPRHGHVGLFCSGFRGAGTFTAATKEVDISALFIRAASPIDITEYNVIFTGPLKDGSYWAQYGLRSGDEP